MNYFLLFLLTIIPFYLSSKATEEPTLSSIVGQSLWYGLSDQDKDYVNAFIAGMSKCEKEKIPSLSTSNNYQMLDEYNEIKNKKLAKKNQEETEVFFKKLKNEKDLKILIGDRLYYRELALGKGNEIQSLDDRILFRFKVQSPQGNILSEAKLLDEETPIALHDLISGVAFGMKGMKEGGKREIFIHPAFGYGEEPIFPANSTLIVGVELTHICAQSKGSFFPFPNDLALKKIEESVEQLEKLENELKQKIAFQLGVKTWQHFQKGEDPLNLEEVIQAIHQSEENNSIEISSPKMQDLLTEFHWKCYQSNIK